MMIRVQNRWISAILLMTIITAAAFIWETKADPHSPPTLAEEPSDYLTMVGDPSRTDYVSVILLKDPQAEHPPFTYAFPNHEKNMSSKINPVIFKSA